jgi:hypothetical protein
MSNKKNITTTTGDTYTPKRQREALQLLASALDIVTTALRNDECGDPRLNGRHGHIYAVPTKRGAHDGYHIYIRCSSTLAWTWTKKKLASLVTVMQDGDDEGILFLAKLPSTPADAALIRSYVGISKRPVRSPEHLEALRMGGLIDGQRSAENWAGASAPDMGSQERGSGDFWAISPSATRGALASLSERTCHDRRSKVQAMAMTAKSRTTIAASASTSLSIAMGQ